MAKTGLKVKQARLEARRVHALALSKKMKFATKHYNRCKLCGKVGAYNREFGICRVCFRTLARKWLIMWVKKASW